ncbi:type I restriction enzyme HsdR N-terminal domain-containing protein [Paradesulfitobacterium aromaticivorans]
MLYEFNLDKYSLPEKYKRNGLDCFFDPIRKKLIQITPEECVRQKMIKFLIEEMDIPQNYIRVEFPLGKVERGVKGRADIVVLADSEDISVPIIVIECKAPTVELTDFVLEQVVKYDNTLQSNIIAITNGNELVMKAYTQDGIYRTLNKIPSFKEIIESDNKLDYVKPEIIERPKYQEYFDKDFIKEFEDEGVIGEVFLLA